LVPLRTHSENNKKHTDLIFEVDYNDKEGWETPKISGYHEFEIDPRNSVLHYAVQTFEGISASRSQTNQDKILLFRPENYIQRLKKSASRLGFPVK
jgi:branched-chain amino acid aminotransferase